MRELRGSRREQEREREREREREQEQELELDLTDPEADPEALKMARDRHELKRCASFISAT